MIRSRTVLEILNEYMPRRQWVSSKDIYALVEAHVTLDARDRIAEPPLSKTPAWKICVRNVLLQWLKAGKIRSRSRSVGT